MKTYCLPIILLMLMCISCVGYEHPFSKESRMQRLLLYAEEMNREYIMMDTIQFMPEVVDYYKQHGTDEERMRAYYMLGSVYRDRGNSPQALVYYREAIHQVDTLSCHQVLLSKIYAQMASLFHLQRFPQKEFSLWKQCYYHALVGKDSLLAVQALDQLASAYYDAGMIDSSILLTDLVHREYLKLGRQDYAASSMSLLIEYHLKHGDYLHAKSVLNEYVSASGHVINGEAERGYELIYFYFGRFNELQHKLDSALFYYNKLLSSSEDISNLENGYRGLMSVYTHLGIADSVFKYAELFANANDTANFLNSANEISRAEMLYNFSESQQQAKKKNDEMNRLWHHIYIISLVILVIVLGLSWFTARQRRIFKQQLAQINQKYNDTLFRYIEATRSLDSLKLSAADNALKKEEEINELRRVLISYQENLNIEKWDVEQSLFNHEIVQRLHKYAVRIVLPTDSEWEDLSGIVSKLLPDFYQRLIQNRKCLTEKEYRICLLIRLHFIPSEVAVLLNLTKQRVTNMRGTINRKLFHQDGARTVDQNLYHLERDN
jgi:tetratricopeptide (TPR) repeat protein